MEAHLRLSPFFLYFPRAFSELCWSQEDVVCSKNGVRVYNICVKNSSDQSAFWKKLFWVKTFFSPFFCVCPHSELQRIHRVRSGQHFVPDWSDRKPGCKRCAGTGWHRVRCHLIVIVSHMIWQECLHAEGCAYCAADRRHPGLQTLGCDWWFSRGFPVLSSGWSVPRVLQSVCRQEPCH